MIDSIRNLVKNIITLYSLIVYLFLKAPTIYATHSYSDNNTENIYYC